MGYTTNFSGSVPVDPPLNAHEIDYLTRFSQSRRMNREQGPYFAEPGDNFGQSADPGIRDFDRPPAGQPGLWCQWVPTAEGTAIEWDGGEKFSDSPEWMRYLLDTFLRPGAVLQTELGSPVPDRVYDAAFEHFTFDHVLSGVIDAQGEDGDDRWRLMVRDNKVAVQQADVVFPDPDELFE